MPLSESPANGDIAQTVESNTPEPAQAVIQTGVASAAVASGGAAIPLAAFNLLPSFAIAGIAPGMVAPSKSSNAQPAPGGNSAISSGAVFKSSTTQAADAPTNPADRALLMNVVNAEAESRSSRTNTTTQRDQPATSAVNTANATGAIKSVEHSAARSGFATSVDGEMPSSIVSSPVPGAKPNRENTGARLRIDRLVDQRTQAGTLETAPAARRAAFVEQGIRLENATGQAATNPGIDAQVAAPRSGVATASPVVLAAGGPEAHLGLSTRLFAQGDDSTPPSVASQASRGLTAMVNQRGGSMTMRLDPPELGQLRVQMTIVGGNVTAEFTAGTQQTQALLDRHITALRSSLESQGLTVERLTVHATTAASSQQMTFKHDDGANAQQQNQQWSNQHDAGGSESRGRREHAEHAPQRHFDAGELTFESLFESGELLASSNGAHSSWPV